LKFATKLGVSVEADRVTLSPGHKTISLEVIVTVWAFRKKKAILKREKNMYFFIIRNDIQI
jgi:hypothetical protein